MADQEEYDLSPQEPTPQSKDPRAPGFVPPKPIVEKAVDPELEAKREDAETNRASAMLAYLPGLFIVPLIFAPRSAFARFHANQGLLVFCYFIFMALVWLVCWAPWWLVDWFPAVATLMYILEIAGCFAITFSGIGLIALVVIGVIFASNGEVRPLPVIGTLSLIKPIDPPTGADPPAA